MVAGVAPLRVAINGQDFTIDMLPTLYLWMSGFVWVLCYCFLGCCYAGMFGGGDNLEEVNLLP